MSIGLLYLAVGFVIAVVGVFWWMHSRSTKSHAKRRQPLTSREAGQQPWAGDKDGGRGNR